MTQVYDNARSLFPMGRKGVALLACLVLMAGCVDDMDLFPDDPLEKYLGHWKCAESSLLYGGGYVFDVHITRNPERSDEILMANFYHQGMAEKARALVTGNHLTIMEQGICNGTIIVKGSGRYANGEITMEYTAFDGADTDEVTARLFIPTAATHSP